jgi:predicted lipoprotein with Yx(FWY)xxD motif
MKRLLLCATAVALVACGSDGTVGSPSTGGADAQSHTVSIAAAGGLGDILVDSSGKALYTPDQEADGTVHCVEACISIWMPLAAGATAPTAPAGAPTLGVIDRPDGTKQVTAAGRPLYTFSQDSAGNVTGDGVADDFGDQHFTWHVVHSDGTITDTPTGSTPAPTGEGYGY